MVRVASLGSKEDRSRTMRYIVFIFAMVIILFRREKSTVRSVQQASVRKAPVGYSARQYNPSNGEATAVATVNRFDEDNETLPDLKDVLAEARRDEMSIRFSNETWVTEWRAEQAAIRAKQKVRNIDWSKVDCIDSKEKYEKCDLSDDRYGVSVVFISFGRSGSSITWETMSNLASERGQPAREDIGGSSESAMKELEKLNPKEHGKCWLERILCRHQYNNRVAMKNGEGKAEIIGTKWKPFLKPFNHTKSREALEWLAGNPHIKVIFNERNFLDGTCTTTPCEFWQIFFQRLALTLSAPHFFSSRVPTVAISRYKHLHTNAPAHCYGEQCIEYHKMQLANTTVPVRFVKDSIALMEKQADGITSILEELKVPHLKIVYEKLYYARRADQWMDLFRFVGVGPMMGLEMKHVNAVRRVASWRAGYATVNGASSLTDSLLIFVQHMTQFSTHADDRSEAIANFEQIRKALRHSEFNKYLRPVVRKSGSVANRGEVVLD